MLNRLEVDVDDMADKDRWARLLISVIRLPVGLEILPSHYWRLLDKLVSDTVLYASFVPCDVEVMTSLEEAEDLPLVERPTSELMDDIEQVCLKLLLQRPSALPRFEELCEGDTLV